MALIFKDVQDTNYFKSVQILKNNEELFLVTHSDGSNEIAVQLRFLAEKSKGALRDIHQLTKKECKQLIQLWLKYEYIKKDEYLTLLIYFESTPFLEVCYTDTWEDLKACFGIDVEKERRAYFDSLTKK